MPDIQSHLFKVKQGSENSAKRPLRSRQKEGKAVFLTHIEKLSKSLQEKLAAALKNDPGKTPRSSLEFLPVRLYASSSKDLNALAAKDQFNPDLLKIFKETTLEIPPLRDYAANIPMMAKEYFEKLSGLISELKIENEVGLPMEIKHFFSGAALYFDGVICASISPMGLAFKLSDK